MNKSRNLVKEIHEKRERFSFDSDRFEEFFHRINCISSAYDALVTDIKDDKDREELIRYIPITLVAAMEGYFRAVIKDLVDTGGVFLERLETLKDIKIPINIITAVQGEKVSLGEFISHILPMSSMEHINKNLSIFLDFDFFDVMKNAKFDIGINEDNLIPADDDLFGGLAKIYELRNIYCHEIALKHKVEIFDAVWGIFSTEYFVSYSEIMVMGALNDAK